MLSFSDEASSDRLRFKLEALGELDELESLSPVVGKPGYVTLSATSNIFMLITLLIGISFGKL